MRGHDASLAYHANLLSDVVRMDAYDRALRALVKPGDVVLDVGAGTGVLAMLAARAGAKRVHAVESMPVAALAEKLVRDNGLQGQVIVHQADLVTLEPIEPVDLVVSDFMGRFVVDDDMLAAVQASAAWLAPGGRFCPQQVDMLVAPVAIGHFPPLDVFESPVGGLDMSAAARPAQGYCYGVELEASAVLAEAATLHRLTPPQPVPTFDATLAFEVTAGGRLRGLACWFEAALAPDVTLSTRPGSSTHWSQLLLPVPATSVLAGDRLQVRLKLPEDGVLNWQWHGELRRGERTLCTFDLDGEQCLEQAAYEAAPPVPRLSREQVLDLDESAAQHAAAGHLEHAVEHLERALRGLAVADADLVGHLSANLGGLHAMQGHHRPAIGPLMRALDGDLEGDEQTARLLVDALFRGALPRQGAEALARYQAVHGPHPSGWRMAGETTEDADQGATS